MQDYNPRRGFYLFLKIFKMGYAVTAEFDHIGGIEHYEGRNLRKSGCGKSAAIIPVDNGVAAADLRG